MQSINSQRCFECLISIIILRPSHVSIIMFCIPKAYKVQHLEVICNK